MNIENFSTVQDDFPTRGTPVGDYTGVRVLTLAFYASDGTELYKHSQLRNDPSTYETFGEFDCSLPMGTHTMVVIGYGGTTPFNLTSPVSAQFVGERLQDTFVATQFLKVRSRLSRDGSPRTTWAFKSFSIKKSRCHKRHLLS